MSLPIIYSSFAIGMLFLLVHPVVLSLVIRYMLHVKSVQVYSQHVVILSVFSYLPYTSTCMYVCVCVWICFMNIHLHLAVCIIHSMMLLCFSNLMHLIGFSCADWSSICVVLNAEIPLVGSLICCETMNAISGFLCKLSLLHKMC